MHVHQLSPWPAETGDSLGEVLGLGKGEKTIPNWDKMATNAVLEPGDGHGEEKEVEAIKEICQHMGNVLDKLFSQDVSSYPPEAREEIEAVTQKMKQYLGDQSGNPRNSTADRGELPSAAVHANHSSSESSGVSDNYDSRQSSSDEPGTSRRRKVKLKKRQRPDRTRGHQAAYHPSGRVKQEARSRQQGSAQLEMSYMNDRFIQALERLDTRCTPRPQPFDQASGQSLRQFLQAFENYCRGSFRGSEDTWIDELGRYLEGDLAHAYNSLKIPGEGYWEVKRKLLAWHKESKEWRNAGSRDLFRKARMHPGESLRLFAARLEKLYRLAYSNREVEESRTLREKYCDAVPRGFKKQIKTLTAVTKCVQGDPVTWSNITQLASQFDASLQREGSSTSDDMDTYSIQAASKASWPVQNTSSERGTAWSQGGARSGGFARREPQGSYHKGAKQTPWQALRPTELQKQQISECWYCHRLGHARATWCKLLGQCLAREARDHFLAACPMREGTARVALRRSARGRQTRPHVSFSVDEEGGTTEHNDPGPLVGN